MATADALPTAQIDGVAFAQVIAGNTVFVGGQFTGVRPAGSGDNVNESKRYNLMAYNLTTGAFTSFAPNIRGVVKELALSADQKTLYVGGKFNLVNNVARENFAALNVSDGKLLTLPAPVVNDSVNAITVVGSTIYLGGAFNKVAGESRAHLAAVSASTGVPTSWAPSVANGVVQALVASPDRSRVIAGGNFDTLAGSTALGMGSVDATTGALRPWKINTIVKNKGESSAILTLNVDGDTVYGGGYSYGGGAAGGNYEGVFAADPTTGDVKWLQDCHGDTYDVAPVGNTVYSVGHAHFCANIGGFPESSPRAYNRALAVTKQATGTVNKNGQAGANYGNFEGQPAPSLYNWFPDINSGGATDQTQGAWSIRGTSNYVSVVGEFTEVNRDPQQGLVRFALPSVSGNPVDEGPVDTDAGLVTTATVTGTSVTVGWKANWDRDDQVLSYDVLRNNVLLKTVKVTSQFWRRPALSFVDKSGTPGASYTYKVRVSDPDQNRATSNPTAAVAYPSNTAYAELVRADGATHQWRLGSALGGSPDPDSVGGVNLSTAAGVTREAPGAFRVDADTAARLNGSADAKASTSSTTLPAGPVSVEAWFKTSSTTGGALVGFDAQSDGGATVTGDRQVYLTSTGRVAFAARAATGGAVDSATSETAYADGKWHQVVAVQSAAGLVLFVDGVRVATDTSSQQLPALTGSWTLGGATGSGLPAAPTGTLTGAVDDVSVTASALTVRQVYEHYRTGTQRFVVSDSGTTRR